RDEIGVERILMSDHFVDGDVVHFAVRRPEPRERAGQRAEDVLRGRDGDVALVAASAEENDYGHVAAQCKVMTMGKRHEGRGMSKGRRRPPLLITRYSCRMPRLVLLTAVRTELRRAFRFVAALPAGFLRRDRRAA